jgi:hypothetical protein
VLSEARMQSPDISPGPSLEIYNVTNSPAPRMLQLFPSASTSRLNLMFTPGGSAYVAYRFLGTVVCFLVVIVPSLDLTMSQKCLLLHQDHLSNRR